MIELENIIMFTGEFCGGCKIAKTMLDKEGYCIKTYDVDTKLGSDKAALYDVRNLPTFVNTVTSERLIGSYPLSFLKSLNNKILGL